MARASPIMGITTPHVYAMRFSGQVLDQGLDFPRSEGVREGAPQPPLVRLPAGRQDRVRRRS